MFKPAGNRPAERKDDGSDQQQPRHEVEECHLRSVQQHDRSARSPDKARDRHRNRHTQVSANVLAISRNRRKLTRPKGDGVGSVGLDWEDFHAQHGRKQQKRSPAGHGIQQSGEKGRNREPKPMPIHVGGEGEERDHLLLILSGSAQKNRLVGFIPARFSESISSRKCSICKAHSSKDRKELRMGPLPRRPDPQFLMKSGGKAVSAHPDPPPLAI